MINASIVFSYRSLTYSFAHFRTNIREDWKLSRGQQIAYFLLASVEKGLPTNACRKVSFVLLGTLLEQKRPCGNRTLEMLRKKFSLEREGILNSMSL
jgi:hypothetical protein